MTTTSFKEDIVVRKDLDFGITDNDIPDVLKKWRRYSALYRANDTAALKAEFGDKTKKAFMVSADAIRAENYDLSLNRYKEQQYQTEEYDSPKDILARLKALNERYRPASFSEHLAWSTHDGAFLNDLLPLP